MTTVIVNSRLFVFASKTVRNCNAENDIAARRCRRCDTILVDPDDMLKAALKLKGRANCCAAAAWTCSTVATIKVRG